MGYSGDGFVQAEVSEKTRSAVANRARCGPEITLGEWREYSATQKYRYTAQMEDVQIK
jgi:hypothetical protein